MDNIIINSREKILEYGKVFDFTNEESFSSLAHSLKNLDTSWGIHIKNDYLNNYENGDYLVVADVLQSIRRLHKTIYYNPETNQWMRNNKEIPYIHLNFTQENALTIDNEGNVVPDDKKLNMGVQMPFFNGTHKLNFNYYWLQQYIGFLQRTFDDNEELFQEMSEETPAPEEYANYSELMALANQISRSGSIEQSKLLRIYAESAYNKNRILKPVPVNVPIEHGRIEASWGFFDKKRNGISIPLKRQIYNTSGFAAIFPERNAFIAEVFFSSLMFILGHETAHVARGHWNLRIKERDYSQTRNVMMNCEINADWTSAYWMLNDFLYHTIDGNPYSPILCYTKNDLSFLMSVRIFSCYLCLSWAYREDREWTENNLDDFINNLEATHPIYNFRVYNILGKIKQHIEEDYIKKKDNEHILTVDGASFGFAAKDAFDKAMDMILSFESAFKINWESDERDIVQKLRQNLFIEKESKPDEIKRIPFMLAYQFKAQEEFARYERQWPEILEKLRKHGMYFYM